MTGEFLSASMLLVAIGITLWREWPRLRSHLGGPLNRTILVLSAVGFSLLLLATTQRIGPATLALVAGSEYMIFGAALRSATAIRCGIGLLAGALLAALLFPA